MTKNHLQNTNDAYLDSLPQFFQKTAFIIRISAIKSIFCVAQVDSKPKS